MFFHIFSQRYLNHLTLLISAIHILTNENTSLQKLEHAEQLLTTFVKEFVSLYGATNFVFNIHLLLHLPNCVRFIGPLFTYSNYCFEDHIGHLLSLQKGTTDVASQISEKYIMQKNVFEHLSNSLIALEFFKEIDNHHKYPISKKVEKSIVLGKQKNALDNDRLFIISSLNLEDDIQIDIFDSVLLHSKVYYETNNRNKKRTYDAFILNTETENFAEIKLIFVIQNKLYFLVDERFEVVHCENSCDSIIYLKYIGFPSLKVIQYKLIGPKFALITFDDVMACAQFPNMYERN